MHAILEAITTGSHVATVAIAWAIYRHDIRITRLEARQEMEDIHHA